MNRFCFYFTLFLSPFFLMGQVITVSEEISLNNEIAYEILGEMGGQILFFRDNKTSFEIQAFNQQLKQSWSKELILDRRMTRVLGIIPTPEDFTLIYSFRQKGNTILKAHRYDPAANLIDSSSIKNLGYLFYTPNFEIVRSEDRSKALIFHVENQDIIRAYAFDLPTQSMLWEKSIAPEDFTFHRDFSQAVLSNKGEMSIILERDNFRSKRKDHTYEIYSFSGSGEVKTSTVFMGDHLTYDAYFTADNVNNQLVASGLYSTDHPERAKGYFYFKVADNASQTTVIIKPFEELFLQNLLGDDYREEKGVEEVSIRETVLRRDGGLLLIGERNRQLNRRTGTTSRAYYNSASARYLVDYYYEEIFVLSIHPDGELHWETILHKKQYSQDDNGIYSSYFLFKTPGRLRFLFNDEIRNENTISEYVINGTGHFDRNSLFSTMDLDLRLRFRDAIQITGNSLIIPSERRNRIKLVRLDY